MWTYLTSCVQADAQTQMALDAELLLACEESPATAFLRFYRFDPAAVTIGRNQQWRRVVDPDLCATHGWDWVRRPTGGGALLHQHEVNYAVVIGREVLEELRLSGFSSVYAWIARGLTEGIRSYISNPVLHTGRSEESEPRSGAQHGLCGRSFTRYEIGSSDGKVLAAAQMIRNGAVLQHGTVYLRPPSEIDRFWPQNPLSGSKLGTGRRSGVSDGTMLQTTTERLTQRWAGLGEKACREPWEEVAAVLGQGFMHASGLAGMKTGAVPALVYNRLEARCALWQREDWHRRR
jgi:lipoate-protein ligase A